MEEKKTEKMSKRGKRLIIIIIGIILGFSLISFIADMMKQKAAEGNDVQTAEEPKDNVDYIKDIDVGDDSSANDPKLVAATFKGAADGNTIRVLLDNDDVVVHLAGTLSADKITGMGMDYRNQAREWMSKQFDDGMAVYLAVTDHTDSEYSALVFDQADLDFTDENVFWNHCINAKELLDGYGTISNDVDSSYYNWMTDAFYYAQSNLKGIWDCSDNFTICGYNVPDKLMQQEEQEQEEEAKQQEETESKKKKKKSSKSAKFKKNSEKIDNTEN